MVSVLVTGANRGIGLGIVRHFLAHENSPAMVIATCRDTSRSSDLLAIANEDPRVKILQLDVTNVSTFGKFAEEVSSLVGENGLNVLINNAGIGRHKMTLQDVTAEDYIDTLTTNVVGPVFITKALLPLIQKAAETNKNVPEGMKRAVIVNMSSLLGSVLDNKSGGHYAYRESKVALNTFSINLYKELRSTGIIVVPVHPGWVKTDMGGPNAPITTDQSCAGLVDVIYNLDESKNGMFFNWDGSLLPW